jgi:hypothetical protein
MSKRLPAFNPLERIHNDLDAISTLVFMWPLNKVIMPGRFKGCV